MNAGRGATAFTTLRRPHLRDNPVTTILPVEMVAVAGRFRARRCA